MKKCVNYYEKKEISPLFMENISDQSKIHEYEKRGLELNLDKPSFVKVLNVIR